MGVTVARVPNARGDALCAASFFAPLCLPRPRFVRGQSVGIEKPVSAAALRAFHALGVVSRSLGLPSSCGRRYSGVVMRPLRARVMRYRMWLSVVVTCCMVSPPSCRASGT